MAVLRGKGARRGERNSCIKYDNVTQDDETFVQYKSHQAHRREQEATGGKQGREPQRALGGGERRENLANSRRTTETQKHKINRMTG